MNAVFSVSADLEQDENPRAAQQTRAAYLRAWLGGPGRLIRYMMIVAAGLPCAVHVAGEGAGPAEMMAAVALAAFLSGIAGFAFSAIAGAMLFHLSGDPVKVVQIMIACSIANQASMTWSLRRNINWRELSPYLAGGAPGLGIGVWVLLHADRWAYMHAMGMFLLVYGAYMLVRKPIVLRRRLHGIGFAVGLLGGITGGAAGFPGAALSIWCGMQGWDRDRQRAIVQPFILIMQVAAMLVIRLMHHQAAAGVDADTLLFIPASLLGTTLGLALYHRMSDGQFARAVNVLLIVSGLSFVS